MQNLQQYQKFTYTEFYIWLDVKITQKIFQRIESIFAFYYQIYPNFFLHLPTFPTSNMSSFGFLKVHKVWI